MEAQPIQIGLDPRKNVIFLRQDPVISGVARTLATQVRGYQWSNKDRQFEWLASHNTAKGLVNIASRPEKITTWSGLRLNVHIETGVHALALPGQPFANWKEPAGLWKHQRDGIRLLQENHGCAGIFFDMGTGKTRAVMEFLKSMGGGIHLIVCPQKVGYVWRDQADLYMKGTPVVLATEGSSAQRAKTIDKTGSGLVVINYDVIWRDPIDEVLLSKEWGSIVMDESHRIKDYRPGARAARMAARLSYCTRHRILMTGTPMPHSPMDIWSQFRFMDPSIFGNSFASFRNLYARMGGYMGKKIVGFQNLDVLSDHIARHAITVKIRDVLDLPETIYDTHRVSLGSEGKKLYDQMEDEMIAELETGVLTAANAMVRTLRFQQITSGTVNVETENGTTRYVQVDTSKQEALSEIMEGLDINEPLIVVCRFIPDLDIICRVSAANERVCLEISGRCDDYEKWKASRGGCVMAVQIRSGSIGLDFSRACRIVFYSTGMCRGDYEQAMARIVRSGQKRTTHIINLVAEGTYDETILRTFKTGADTVETILEELKRKQLERKGAAV